MTYGNRHGIECRALARNNSAARFSYILLNIFGIKLGTLDAGSCDKSRAVLYRNIGNIGYRPRNERRVAMLAENISMNIALVYIVILGESRTQARGIEYRTGTDDMALGNIRELVESISQNINGIADYYTASGAYATIFGMMLFVMFTFVCASSSLVCPGFLAMPDVRMTMSESTASR